MPKDIYTTPPDRAIHDAEMLARMTGETTSLEECSILGRRLIQALLIAPKRTEREAETAFRLATVLGALLPVLEERVPQDVCIWDSI
jgi:hypothetical protein